MTVEEFITLFRRNTENPSYTYDRDLPDVSTLWSNFQLIQYLNEAQDEFAERTYCFKDRTTFTLDVVAGEADVEADERILKVERAERVSDNIVLDLKTIEQFQQGFYDDDYGLRRVTSWETRTGTPRTIITDLDSGYFRLYPIPTENDTINLAVRRLPLHRLQQLDDHIEIPNRWVYTLMYKVQELAYSHPLALANGFGDGLMYAKQQWEKNIVDASSKYKIKQRGPGVTRYGGL